MNTIPYKVGGGGLYKLAPDLDRISNQNGTDLVVKRISGIDATAGLTTVLNLTGKWLLTTSVFVSVLAETVTVKLTVDGVVIINDTFTVSSSRISILGVYSTINTTINDAYIYSESTLLLEIETTSDTDIVFDYNARPIA